MLFQIDRIVAKQHGGSDAIDNLALACITATGYKGPTVAGADPVTGIVLRLFHPRHDKWDDHFRWNDALVLPLSSIAQVTIKVLQMDRTEIVALRTRIEKERL